MTRLRPHLFFATIAAGGGHVATARAMIQAVEAYFPDRFRLALSDYMKEVGETSPAVANFDRRHKEMWKDALQRPWTARLGQRIIDAFPRLVMRVERGLLDDFARAAARDLAGRDVGLVLSNHGLITAGLSLAKQRYGLRLPVLTFATETHSISAYWADPWADHILVPNESVKRSLQRMGVPGARLEVVGYPVQQAFVTPPHRTEARAALGLPERFTVLVSLGGEGLGGDAFSLVRELSIANPDWQFVAICGRNASLNSRLKAEALANVRLEGFTEYMADFLAACDAVVGKAGPASVYEALAVGRPVLVTSYAGLNERGVVRMLEQEGLGQYLPRSGNLVEMLRRYQRHPEDLDAIEERCRELDLPGQTERLARRIISYAEAVA